ncbi:Fic family protein [Paramicrobacterium humi]|uniref:Fic family protein n=1 Tax=Paramicrobacterium humi TaxID=640635 RepID=A0A1H4L1U6_9MICO|nr:Fic family protein [Microbacterium humi]
MPIAAVGSERHLWAPRMTGYYSRSEMRQQSGEYHSTVPAPLVDWQPVLSPSLSADVEDATRALLDFDLYALRILSSSDAALAPMSAILLRTESASSSQIENVTASARQLALAEINETDATNARSVVGNVHAMEAAMALAGGVSLNSILAMHKALMEHDFTMRMHAGSFRNELVWIGRGNAGPLGADFVAPQHEHIPAALSDLVTFVNRDDIPVLVQVATAHAQFETIHPFVDGNGRTGRALAHAMLKNKGLVSHTTVPLSAGLLADTESYFSALGAFRSGNAGPIIERFAEAARFAAVSGRHLIDRLTAEIDASRGALAGVRAHAAAWSVLPLLVGQPVVTSSFLKSKLGLNDATVQRTLALLSDRGVLHERTARRRNRVWEHTGILAALDEYAETVRRGTRNA